MTDGARAMELKSRVYTWCDGCQHHKARSGKRCGSPLIQVNCPVALALEALELYEQEKRARKAAEQMEWTRSLRNDR